MTATIRHVTTHDAATLTRIYNHFIEHTVVTFEEDLINEAEMTRRISEISSEFPYFVIEDENGVQGYAYLCLFRTRRAYQHSHEFSIYLDPSQTGKGYGSLLLEQLISTAKEQNLHALIGGISMPNEASERLHEKFGFRKVAHFPETGQKFGQWIDVGFWQLLL
ncbi:MAG: N-acetyltransferase family protein [Akkermansiaceae bacterium]